MLTLGTKARPNLRPSPWRLHGRHLLADGGQAEDSFLSSSLPFLSLTHPPSFIFLILGSLSRRSLDSDPSITSFVLSLRARRRPMHDSCPRRIELIVLKMTRVSGALIVACNSAYATGVHFDDSQLRALISRLYDVHARRHPARLIHHDARLTIENRPARRSRHSDPCLPLAAHDHADDVVGPPKWAPAATRGPRNLTDEKIIPRLSAIALVSPDTHLHNAPFLGHCGVAVQDGLHESYALTRQVRTREPRFFADTLADPQTNVGSPVRAPRTPSKTDLTTRSFPLTPMSPVLLRRGLALIVADRRRCRAAIAPYPQLSSLGDREDTLGTAAKSTADDRGHSLLFRGISSRASLPSGNAAIFCESRTAGGMRALPSTNEARVLAPSTIQLGCLHRREVRAKEKLYTYEQDLPV
ncbi:hypothetical protein EV122DRAFT_285257 [Schizophyllum commune]